MYALIDCNNFYASCERAFRPDLNGKPIVVLSNNDGCIIARSNEAKAIGIPMAAAAYKLEHIFKENNVKVFSSNYALYGDMSHRVMSLLSDMAPEMEIYSIDEAFVKIESKYIDLQEYAVNIQRTITAHTGIPVSVGVAPTKALAKIANKIAKVFSNRLNNVHVIDTEEKRTKALKWTKIGDVWGIGRQNAKKLHQMQVYNALAFAEMPDAWVRKKLSVVGLRLKQDLGGKHTLELDDVKDKKVIATTRSFERNLSDFEEIKERVVTFAVTCAQKLRQQQSCCNSIMVFIHTNTHRRDLPQHRQNVVLQLPFSSNSSIDLAKFATMALKQIYLSGYSYKKAGVIVLDLVPNNQKQLSLFSKYNPKHDKLMEAVDKLNKGIGEQKVKLASQDLQRTWKMRQANLSPRYTTRLSEIITVKV